MNFKILSCILISLKILAAVCKNPDISCCPWCLGPSTLEHYLFSCTKIMNLRTWILKANQNLMLPWSNCVWCFGALKSRLNPVVWVVNFGIYKAMIRKCEGYVDALLYDFVRSECN